MKKQGRICLVLLGGAFLLFSGCKGLPPSAGEAPPAELGAPPEPAFEPAAPEPVPELIAPGEGPREIPLGALHEPVLPPLAEANLPGPSPAEERPGALPDPPAWIPPPPLPEPIPEPVWEPEPIRAPEPIPEPEPIRAPEPVQAPEPVRAPEPIRAPEFSLPGPQEIEPPPPEPEKKPAIASSPPEFLAPAEEPPPPPAPRGRPALPVNPVPDLPPQISRALQSPEEEDDLSYSRTVRALQGQLVEIPFRGTGWVYLGELGARRGMAYGSRRFDPEGQSFIFRAEEPGPYSLKFYKQDFIRDSIINDYVRVIVGEAAGTGGFGLNPPVDRSRVIAEPRWPPLPGAVAALPPDRAALKDGAGGPPPASAGESPAPLPARPEAAVVPSPPASGEDFTPDQYLNRAREEYDAGRVAAALGFLDQFREQYPAGSDESWWLYGQFLEAGSPSRDIRSALDYYRRLIREYPQSSRYDDARRRISYLERYYFNIP